MPIAVHKFESALRESNRRPTEFHSESRSALELHGIAADQMHKNRESPLVIPCKFSAVTNSAGPSCTHLAASCPRPDELRNQGVTDSAKVRPGVARSAKVQAGRLLIRWSLVRFQPGEPVHYISI
jgi:hypothetical protein